MILRPSLFRRPLHASSQFSFVSTFSTTTTSSSISTRVARLPHTFSPRHRPLLLTSAALGFSLPFLVPDSATLLDTPSYVYSRDAKTPVSKDSKIINPAAVKQISLGSILGLGAGVLVSAFSRTLTLLFGVAIVLIQYAARRGYNIIPVSRLQRYVKGINLRSAINDNVAFKISFGLTFALAAFGGF